MESNPKEFVWVEKYRPRTVKDTILPSQYHKKFQKFVDDENVPNLLLLGPPGVGKTTVAKAMLNEMGADYITINGSMAGNIDTLRYDISKFASSVSFTGGRKYVILDEADYLNPRSTQPALRNFMEEFSSNCGFILTANYKSKILQPLRSRCSLIEFKIKKKDEIAMEGKIFKRMLAILDNEGVSYEKKVVAEIVQRFSPDWRRVINELQNAASTGQVDEAALYSLNFEGDISTLLKALKGGDYKGLREWVENNSDLNTGDFYKALYDKVPEMTDSDSSVSDAIIILAQYQYQEAFAADLIINRAAVLFELAGSIKWK